MTRKFVSTAALATISTGIVMVEGFAGVGEAAEALMGHPVFTHEFPMLSARMVSLIVAQYPDFPTEATPENWQRVRGDVLRRFGDSIEIEVGSEQRVGGPMETLGAAMARAKGRLS